jgi:hypothetical protein
MAEKDIQEILTERGGNYGSFESHADITQELKDVLRKAPKWSRLSNDKKEALEMTMHKIGRILNGDPEYLDSWVDIVGYNQLVVNNLTHKE